MYRLIQLLLIISFVSIGCTEKTVVYTGKKIQMDFRDIRTFESGDWLKIGDTKIIHTDNYDQLNTPLYIPASRTVYYVNEQEKFEPRNPYSIALMIAVNVDQHLNKSEGENIVIDEEKRFLLHISALLVLEEKEGNEFSIEVPEGYPLKIEVLE